MKAELLLTILKLALTCVFIVPGIANAQSPSPTSAKKPNILVIFGDDIGQTNISAYSMGVMGYRTPNIDRIAKEGMMFTDYYAEQSCTAGRSSFITGQCRGELSALAPLLPTPRSWVRAISILVRAGSTTSTYATASRVTLSTLAQA